MCEMIPAYGSEYHLLRWMGRHRENLDSRVLNTIHQGHRITWLDMLFSGNSARPDAEIKGIDFLGDAANMQTINEWHNFWPQGHGIHNWDAVGKLWLNDNEFEWLLVEAKAHLGELRSDCDAAPNGNGRIMITAALNATKRHLGIPEDRDWMKKYYQYANRLAVLYFLKVLHGIPARLLLVYFTGDIPGSGRVCPENEAGWAEALAAQDEYLDLPGNGNLAARVHRLFLPVSEKNG